MKNFTKIADPKIMLVNPPFYKFITFAYAYNPLGIRIISANLKKNGFYSKVYNFDFPEHIDPKEPDWPDYSEDFGQFYKPAIRQQDHIIWKEVEKTIEKENPDILGITLMTPQFETAINLARIAKKVNPKIITLMGGIHTTVFPTEPFDYPEIDAAIVGEGEQSFLEFVQTIDKGGDLNLVNGLVWRNGDGNYVMNEPRQLISDLDSIPFPDEDLATDPEHELMITRGSIYTSRGCPFQCTFCARKPIWGKRIRYRSPENVVQEIKHYYDNYGTRFFMFEDDTLTLKFNRLKTMFNLIKEEDMHISYTIQTKVTFLKPPLMELLKDTGCASIAVGVETGSQYTLDRIKKGITLQQCLDASKISHEYGIHLNAFFIIGYPWETPQLIDETEEFIRKLDADVNHLYLFSPLPGSELFDEVKSSGKLLATEWTDFFFQNPNIFKRDNIDNKWLYYRFLDMKKELIKIRQAKVKFESRSPKYIMNKLRENIHSPKRLWYLGKRFIKLQTDTSLKK